MPRRDLYVTRVDAGIGAERWQLAVCVSRTPTRTVRVVPVAVGRVTSALPLSALAIYVSGRMRVSVWPPRVPQTE